MGLTNFPNGISSFGVPVLGDKDVITGNVYFVDSGAGNANDNNKGTDKNKPLATIDGAVAKCTANNGDVIIVMPGHAETVVKAGGLSLDVAGITVKGIGDGNARPTVTFSTSTAADMNVDAANVTVENIKFAAGVDALLAPIDVNATDLKLVNCEFRDTTGYQTVTWIRATSVSDRLKVLGCKHIGKAKGAESFISITGGTEDIEIIGNQSDNLFSVANISNTSTAVVNATIKDNVLINRGATATYVIDLVATATGTIAGNYCRNTSTASGEVTNLIDTADMELFENYGVTADGETGALIGTVST